MGGVKIFFWKICDQIFFFFENWGKKFWIQLFSKNFIHNTTFWQEIWIQNDFSFHLICILSMFVENHHFSKICMSKLENLCVKLGHFGVTLRKNYGSYEVAQSFYRCTKIPSFIWHHVWTDLGRTLGRRSLKSLLGRFHPPPLYRSTRKPTLIRVKLQKWVKNATKLNAVIILTVKRFYQEYIRIQLWHLWPSTYVNFVGIS